MTPLDRDTYVAVHPDRVERKVAIKYIYISVLILPILVYTSLHFTSLQSCEQKKVARLPAVYALLATHQYMYIITTPLVPYRNTTTETASSITGCTIPFQSTIPVRTPDGTNRWREAKRKKIRHRRRRSV